MCAIDRFSLHANSRYVAGIVSMKYALLGLSAIALSIALTPQAAQASAYRSGNTYVHIKELPFGSGVGNGYYYTTIGGQQWVGSFTTTASSTATQRIYTGTFADAMAGSGARPGCIGTIKLTRSVNNPGPATLQVKWTITGNNGLPCPSAIGTNFTLNVVEALPNANSAGDFNASNANTMRGPATASNTPGGAMTWPKWVTVDPSGLNCRPNPPGLPIQVVLPNNSPIDAILPNAFLNAGGQSWLGSDNNHCHVRANGLRVMPKLMPF
jgi:hypothetical protein